MSRSYSSLILGETGLVSYWRLGEASGTNAADQKGINNGTYTGGNYTLGQTGAIVADSNTSVVSATGALIINVADSASLRPTAISMEFWASPGNTITDYRSPGGKTTSSAWTDGYGFYWLSGNLYFFINNYISASVSAPLAAGAPWAYFVGTYDGAMIRLYKNASLISSLTYSTAITHSTQLLNISAISSNFGWFGLLDEVAIYNTALNQNKISQHYAIGLKRKLILVGANLKATPTIVGGIEKPVLA